MAISQMTKLMIISHRTEASALLEELQRAGICQILNAEEAMVSKAWPELVTAGDRPRETEELFNRLTKTCSFLKNYAEASKGFVSVLAPKAVIEERLYEETVSSGELIDTLEEAEQAEGKIENLKTDIENLSGVLEQLEPWRGLEISLEELRELETSKCLTGLLPNQKFEHVKEQLEKIEVIIEVVGSYRSQLACLVVCRKEAVAEAQKLLRAGDFESVSFESMTGTISDSIKETNDKLSEKRRQLEGQYEKAVVLARDLLRLEILCDHYRNLLSKQLTENYSPATEQTVIFEGWCRVKDLKRLGKITASFAASSLQRVEPGEGEEIPVEIDNNKTIQPFESITRLYGMPSPTSVDPTVFLAPFFAIFFGLCLTDAGYGVVLSIILLWLIRKIQGDKKMLWMFFVCAILSIGGGIITGGWFGDAVQSFIPQADKLRKSLILFDPMEKPMVFFGISLGLGYIQIMFGLFVALFHHLRNKNVTAAICDKLTWLVMLNSLILFGLSKGSIIPEYLSKIFGITAIVPALVILLFSERQGPWAGRIGMGVFNLFCTVFYVGDILSYVRIMALGMVTGGFGMAVNILAKLASGAPYIGWFLGLLIFVGMHLFNLGISVLGSFVHSMRLQFVEFFPKFFEGGGRQFQPLAKEFKHIRLNK